MKNPLNWRTLSMTGRLLALLIVSLVISQIVDALLFLHERSSIDSNLSVREAGGQAADLIALMDGLDQNGRAQARRSFEPHLNSPAEEHVAIQRPARTDYRHTVAELLRTRLPLHHDLQVITPDPARRVDILLADRSSGTINAAGPSFDILTTLRGGEGLVLRVIVPANFPPSYALVFSFVFTLIATLCAGTFIFTRSTARRLRRLAEATEAVGRGLQPAAIPESGPPELRLLAHAFNRMQDRLRRYVDSRTRVVAAMSHDLRTPITRLRLRVTSVADPVLQSKMTDDLEQMASMVQESLDSLQGMESTEHFQPVRIESLLRALQLEYEELGFPLEIQNAVSESVPARPQALRRALTNLLDNARQFATAATIRAQRIEEECVFLIADNGPGIPDDQLDHVFEPFYRLESSRNRNTGGAGLGLSIARDIAHAHGGTLSLANKRGGGLEARLTLPMSVNMESAWHGPPKGADHTSGRPYYSGAADLN